MLTGKIMEKVREAEDAMPRKAKKNRRPWDYNVEKVESKVSDK